MQKPVLSVPLLWAYFPDIFLQHLGSCMYHFWLTVWPTCKEFPCCQRKHPSKLDLTCLTSFGQGDNCVFYLHSCCFSCRSQPQTQLSTPVIILQRKFLSFLAWSYCFWSSFSWHGINFAAMCLMYKLSVKMHQQVLYYRPRTLQSYATCPHWSLDTLFPHFHQSDWWWMTECSEFSTTVWPLLKYEYHLKVCVLLVASLQKALLSTL